MYKEGVSNSIRKIAITGAGPAGSSLAIRLARSGFDVTLIERERFPRHKLCGEFISPECIDHFRELEVSENMLASGGDRIGSTVFYASDGNSVDVPSEWFVKGSAGALGLSRAKMDLILLEKARELGVKVLEETSVKAIGLEGKVVRSISVKQADQQIFEVEADAFVDATGRARVLSKLAERSFGTMKTAGRQKWVGFKAHFKGAEMEPGRCEIYFFRGGYGGLNYVEDGVANHCFLIRAEVVKEFGGSAEDIFREVIIKNARAGETLANANRMHEWIAVSIDEFGRRNPSRADNLFNVGDSAAFIDPFTGSGMLMAFESSQILSECIMANTNNLQALKHQYQLVSDRRFAGKLRVCSIMRSVSFSPHFAKFAIKCLQIGSFLRYGLAKATRTTTKYT